MKALYVEQIHNMKNGVCRMLQNGDLTDNTVCGMIVLWTDWMYPTEIRNRISNKHYLINLSTTVLTYDIKLWYKTPILYL